MNTMACEDAGPYVAGRAFTLDDQGLFFGRDREIRDAVATWRDNSLVVLHGPAGSGKTSLLQAGVTPLLAEDSEVLPLGRTLAASSFPEPLLADHNPYCLAVLGSWSPAEPQTTLAQESLTSFLRRRSRLLRWSRPTSPIFLAIDHLDEILADDRRGQDRDDFFADLATAMREVPQLRVLLAVRTEALSQLAAYEKELARDGIARLALAPLTPEAAVEAVRRPMEAVGRRFAPGAAEYLVDGLSAPLPQDPGGDAGYEPTLVVQPAQLQAVCARLWATLPAEPAAVTRGFIRENVDVDGVLAGFCASAVIEVSARHQVAVPRIFDWLVQSLTAADGSPGHAQQSTGMAAAMPAAALATLEDQHVLTAYMRSGTRNYQLANNRLAAAIRRLGQSSDFGGKHRIDAAASMRIAESALAGGDLASAQNNAEEALETADAMDLGLQADARSLLGNIAYRDGHIELAERQYMLAAELRELQGDTQGAGQLFGAIGRMHVHQGRFAAAIEDLNAAIARLPTELMLQTELATALWRSGQPQAAAAVFGAVLAVAPESADALAGRGQILSERGDAKAALDDLLNLRRLRPSVGLQPEVRSAYALALARTGRPETAMAEANAALAEARDSGIILLRAARVARTGGALDHATELLRRAEKASHPALSPDQLIHAHRLRDAISGSHPEVSL